MRFVRSVLAFSAATTLPLACGSVDDAAPASSCAGVELLVAANSTDFQSSVICGAPGSCRSGADLGGDPVLATSNGRAFFVSRDKDLIFELDPSCGTPAPPSSVHTLAPRGSAVVPANPHDVAAAPDGTLVVPLYNSGRVAFMKDGAILGSLDLSSYDADGNPQPEGVRIVDVEGASKAFVTLERLDDRDHLLSKQKSQILRIDVASRTVEAAVDLTGKNPFNAISELNGSLFLAEPGNFDAVDEDLAGIERFDAKTSTAQLLVHEKDLGGSVAEVAVTNGCGAAIVAGIPLSNPTSVVTFDPATGRVIMSALAPALGPTSGYDLYGLAWHDKTLYVGDRRRVAGGYPVHVLERTDDCRLTDTGRTILIDRAPVALRAAQHPQGR